MADPTCSGGAGGGLFLDRGQAGCRERRRVNTWRCDRCGYLESYAPSATPSLAGAGPGLHRGDTGGGPRPTSDDPPPARVLVRQRGAYSRTGIASSFASPRGALLGGVPVA